MIRAFVGDITRLVGVSYVCNAANGIGPMGAGVAGAFAKAGGPSVVKDAYHQCKELDPQPGGLYVTTAGNLPYRAIIHLVTMKNPGGETSLDIVRACLRSLISFCRVQEITLVALPALGTGVGRLPINLVAEVYKEELASSDIEFVVVDKNPAFIKKVI